MKKHAVVLLIMASGERRRALTPALQHAGVDLITIGSCRGARELLRVRLDITVVVTDLTLADGNWCDMLEYTLHRDVQTAVLVVSPVGGERLWAEVLWRGAHDLIIEPLENIEVRRAVEGAVRAGQAAEYGAMARQLALRRIPSRLPAAAVPSVEKDTHDLAPGRIHTRDLAGGNEC